ncbi:hypothetical protein SAMN05443575_0300 [Jatrophihabitans endophyticus]|uniref:VOC domain-containing protein n=2 Tax=Jatrophihabitans endophyticus TaxID=1206085 RepID=A0A1M5CNL9_9ACTN|nr:VOC family protein [Jatrophihabitans endophyticus]SHF56256.1 hypothetical protein SAMN05443575_0300 [Jatrophihabitans endophyticus]
MTMRNIAVDCADPYELATFWSSVVGRPLLDEDEPGDPEAVIVMPSGPALFFQRVPEPKVGKNRLHVCLTAEDTVQADVDRLVGLGARLVQDRRTPDGRGWVVLADPEGNEFCVLRGPGDPDPTRA